MNPPEFPADLPHICVVIPLFNSGGLIGDVLRGLPAFVRSIVVVDDCSQDDSFSIANQVVDERMHIVRHASNQGVGAATLSGYQKALELGAQIIVKMDSDNQMDPAYLVALITPVMTGQADYAKGNRFTHAEALKTMPLLRRVGNAGLSLLTKAATGYWGIFDPTNGYTALHASLVPQLDLARIHRRYFFESSMLVELGFLRAVVRDVEIPARYANETSSLSEWKALFEFPPLLFKGFLRRLVVQHFVRDFGIFSTLLILGAGLSTFGLLFGLYHWYLSIKTMVIASTGTVMIATLPLILGSQLLIQALIVDMQNEPRQPLQVLNQQMDEIRARFATLTAERKSPR
jgi:glycosyltransferase involved in cell wall biosynthesis